MRYRANLSLFAALFLLCFSFAAQALFAQCASATSCTCESCQSAERSYREGHWFVAETTNFRVCCDESEALAIDLSRHAESLRAKLRSQWLGEDSEKDWTPKCEVVLHSSRQSYAAAVGRGSERTVGSSLVKVAGGQITNRRVDLVGGPLQYVSAALPHELTHVVLRDRFPINPIPHWADEGAATLADTSDKQERHRKDLQKALADGTTLSAASLFTSDEYPRADRWGTFYGESVSLTKFLVERDSPARFIGFVQAAGSKGYDKALQDIYGIKNLADLDHEWRRQLSLASDIKTLK
jgi:hypothetical protein